MMHHLTTKFVNNEKKINNLLWIILPVILITNWQGFKNITGINDWYYLYSNQSGTFTAFEEPKFERNFKKPENGFFTLNSPYPYTCDSIPKGDTIVYRLFAINPLKFWRWGEFLFNWRYRLPYTNWEKVESRRGYGILKFQRTCQMF